MNEKRVLITGINGSGASYLAEYIVNNHPDWQIHGISRWHSTINSNNLSEVRNKVLIHECDLNDFGSILNVLKTVNPDYIFHMASNANVRTSSVYPLAVLQNNIIGTANFFEAIRTTKINTRLSGISWFSRSITNMAISSEKTKRRSGKKYTPAKLPLLIKEDGFRYLYPNKIKEDAQPNSMRGYRADMALPQLLHLPPSKR